MSPTPYCLTDVHTILGLTANGFLFYTWYYYGGGDCTTSLGSWLLFMSVAGFAMSLLAFALVLYKRRQTRQMGEYIIKGERPPPISIIFVILENLAMDILCLGSMFIVLWLLVGNYLVWKTNRDQCQTNLILVSKYYVGAYYVTIALAMINTVRRHIRSNGLPCFY